MNAKQARNTMKAVSNAEFYDVCNGRPKAVKVDGGVELQYFGKNKQLIGKACNVNKKISYWLAK